MCCCRRRVGVSIRALAEELASLERIVLICGRYEGVDERVGQHLADRELSIGDYVLSGGELGAAVIRGCGHAADSRRVGKRGVGPAGVVYGRHGRSSSRRRSRFHLRIRWIAGLPALHAARGLSRHGRCPKCWFRAIMKKYAAGAGVRRWRKLCVTGPICWIAGRAERRR